MTTAAIACSAVPVPLPVTITGSGAHFGVCEVCRGATRQGHRICWSCRVIQLQLGTKLTRTVPVSLFAPGSLLHELLVGYKAAPSRRVRQERRGLLARLLRDFLAVHLGCLVDTASASPLALIAVPVPSSSTWRRSWEHEHPLVSVLRAALTIELDLPVAPLLARGTDRVGHLLASPGAFRVVGPVTGRRVLIIEDTYTSGARSQSAAVAIANAGGDVVAIVPIGRLIRPDYNAATAALWARQQRQRFDPRRCAGPCRHASSPDQRPVVAEAVPLGQQQPPKPARCAYEADRPKNTQIERVKQEYRADHSGIEAA